MKLKGEIHLFLIRLAFLLVFLWVLFGLLFGITTMKNNDMSPRISAALGVREICSFIIDWKNRKAGMWWFFRKQERNMWAE